MDIIRAPLVPDKNTKGPKKKLDDYTYYYEDENSGVWPIRRYEPNLMMFSSVDSSFRRDGLSAVEKFVNGLKDEEIDVEKNSFEAMEMLVERMGKRKGDNGVQCNWNPTGSIMVKSPIRKTNDCRKLS